VILSILLAVGKTCITVTLVPGVGLGSSWARSLAKVAAWSTVAGVITALMVHAMPDLREMVRNMAYTAMLRTAGQFVVLAICTFSIPVITEKIFSGAAPAGNAALEAVSKGWQGARTMGRHFSSGAGSPTRSASPGDRGGSGGSHRPHKIAPSRLRQGLAAVGALAVAPIALAVARFGARAPDLSQRESFDGTQGRRRRRAEGGSSDLADDGNVAKLREAQARGGYGAAAASVRPEAAAARAGGNPAASPTYSPRDPERSSRYAAGSGGAAAQRPAASRESALRRPEPPERQPATDKEVG
jgi:hypothetical protein